jgi:hypothetical protein
MKNAKTNVWSVPKLAKNAQLNATSLTMLILKNVHLIVAMQQNIARK